VVETGEYSGPNVRVRDQRQICSGVKGVEEHRGRDPPITATLTRGLRWLRDELWQE